MGTSQSTVHHFRSGNRRIRVETLAGRDERPRRSVILLHGANGVRYANPVISGVIQYLGLQDFAVHLVHYFDRTNTSYEDDPTIHEHFATWLETVEAAVDYLQKDGNGAPLALFGHSLGGFLSAATLIRNPAVQAAVILSGGLDEASALTVKRTAPTLILHGAADTRVPVAEARRLEAALTAAGASPEMHVYPGEGHVLELASYADALDRATRFLRKHLA